MVPVTFPSRAASALQPDLPSSAAPDAGGTAFAGVFGLLGAEPRTPHPPERPGAPPETAAEVPPVQPSGDIGRDPSEDPRDTGDLQDRQPTAQDQTPPQVGAVEAVPPGDQGIAQVTLPGPDGMSILQATMLASAFAVPLGTDQSTSGPAGNAPPSTIDGPALPMAGQGTLTGAGLTLRDGASLPAPVLTGTVASGASLPIGLPSDSAPSGPAPTDLVPSALAQNGHAAPGGAVPAGAAPGLAPPGLAPSGLAPPESALSSFASTGSVSTAQATDMHDPRETGIFVLGEPKGTAARSAAISAGVPAYWAAREAADGAPVAVGPPERQNPITLPVELSTPKPTAMPQADGDSAPLGGEGAQALGETKATGSSPPLSTFATGPGQPAAGPQTPQGGTPEPLPPHVPAQIAAALAARPERPLELRLAPMELGGLTVHLRQDGDILRVVVQADRPDTLDLLRRNGDMLLEELRLAGFSGAALSFGDGGSPQGRQATGPSRPVPAADQTLSLDPPGPSLAPPTAQGLDLRL